MMMWKQSYCIVLFLASVKTEISPQLLPINYCDDYSEIVLQLLFRYFDDQHFITVIEGTDMDPHSMDSVACIEQPVSDVIRPLDVYKMNDINFGASTDNSSVSSYPTTRGYFIRSDYSNIADVFYDKISKHNPRTKLIVNIVGTDLNAGGAKDLIKLGFEKYKMLNVAGLMYYLKFNGEIFLGVDIIFCLYNPFSDMKNEQFKCLNLTAFNLEENLIEMENFLKYRLDNLQKFPLKIHIFEYGMKSVAVYDSSGNISHYTYPDGELISSIAKVMNFTPVYLPHDEGARYGYQLSNGTFTGGLAAIEYDKADILANSKLIANYNTTKAIFLQPITMTKLFFIIQRRKTTRLIMVTIFEELDKIS